jgi:peptidoglycan/xylan/chitin deacetylase (PgdA/CDA1 family)
MGEPTVSELEALLEHLRRWFRFITPFDLLEAISGRQRLDAYSLMLTFDDGYKDLSERLLPLLNRLRLPATVFINTAAMDGEVLWFQKLFAAIIGSPLRETPGGYGVALMRLETVPQRVKAISAFARLQRQRSPDEWTAMVSEICGAFKWGGDLRDEQMMNWEDLERMRQSSWITVGGHSVGHPFLPRCDDSRLRLELVDCARGLRDRLNLGFLPFSYPNGGSDERVVAAVEAAGYDCSFSMTPGLNTPKRSPHRLFRQYVAPDVVGASFDLSFRVS